MKKWGQNVFLTLSVTALASVIIYSLLPLATKCTIALTPLACGSDVPEEFGDVLLVFGCGCAPGWGTHERIQLAAELYHQKRRKVFVSEGICPSSERECFISIMTEQFGILNEDIYWDTLSRNTVENVHYMNVMSDSMNLKQGVVCTSPFHQLRTSILMSKYWQGEYKVAHMRPDQNIMFQKEPHKSLRGKVIRQEYFKLAGSVFQ